MKTCLSILPLVIRTKHILVALTSLTTALLWSAGALVQAEVTAYTGTIDLPTYPWDPPVQHPYFRATDGRNIYPYPMLDNLNRTREPRTWRTVVLENEYLRVTFLPELGGRIYSVLDKTTDQQMFYVNQVVKPGLIGQCGAWISGGVEFNTGPAGHTVSAVQPVDVEILPPAADGSRSVAVGEVERIYRTRWTVVVTLRPGRSFLEERIRIYNLTETVRPYYFWNCTAVPNTPGFRFIYPMTLGTDHGGTEFYTWPFSNGKDLSLGRNYQDAASIFAYQCDQDFFGSYDEEADRGVVAYANHHLLPGKKAWTWGLGSYGTMHQMDLTDEDGPYNEVQTGPLPTQADVGRLDPSEAICWDEWWYPVHGIGSFTFANRDVAVNATPAGQKARLRMLGTGDWKNVQVQVQRDGVLLANTTCHISPRTPVDLNLPVADATRPFEVVITTGSEKLARFRVPLDLPHRTPPAKKDQPSTAAELSQAGWQDFLFARFSEAEATFRKALEKDPHSVTAHTGLAFLNLDRMPDQAVASARRALVTNPDHGPARLVLALARLRLNETQAALDDAWQAALDPATAVPARALAAKILCRQQDWAAVVKALATAGPWQSDPEACNRLALARLKLSETQDAIRIARRNLREDPLDAFARSLLWLTRSEPESLTLASLVSGKPQSVLDLAASYTELGQPETALRILDIFYMNEPSIREKHPIVCYWVAYLAQQTRQADRVASVLQMARAAAVEGVFPHRYETVPVLRWAFETEPKDGQAALYLGHLLFALGRHAEGRIYWQRAAERGAAPAIAYRALGQAYRQLDHNLKAAVACLQRAHEVDSTDPIVAIDLVRALLAQADRGTGREQERALTARSRDILKAAFEAGKSRSDFVVLLARAHNRLNEYADTARMLDSVRITIWEGAHEAHDLFEEAHLALGKAHLAAHRPAEALREFNRALEYPVNLATGRQQNVREAHIHYLRGQALAALGQRSAALKAWKQAAEEPESKDAQKEEARRQAKEALRQYQKNQGNETE